LNLNLDELIRYTFLDLAFLILLVSLAIRIGLFFYSLIKSAAEKGRPLKYLLAALSRLFFPLYGSVSKRPVYTILRYLFHICLIVVPIWYSGHIILWQAYGIDWEWTALPDEWIDALTLIGLGFALCFFVRRIVINDIRTCSTKSDYVLIVVTALPFLTGYALSQGSAEGIPFLDTHMEAIHILTAEAMLVMAAFLFLKVKIKADRCVGCISCTLMCPTDAVVPEEIAKQRTIHYMQCLCIYCANCIRTCPEDAVQMSHELGVLRFFKMISKRSLICVELAACDCCGRFFAPISQLEKLQKTYPGNHINICTICRKRNSARKILKWE